MSHVADNQPETYKMVYGYVYLVASKIYSKYPQQYQVINRGVDGDTLYDLYVKVKLYAWNDTPNYLCIFLGVNDVWHKIHSSNAVEPDRVDKFYRMTLDETIEKFPNVNIVIVELYVLMFKSIIIEKTVNNRLGGLLWNLETVKRIKI